MMAAKGHFNTVTESNVKVHWERGCVVHAYTLVKYPNVLFSFSQKRLLLCLKILFDMKTLSRGGYSIFSTTKTMLMLFVIKVNTWKPSTILKNIPSQMSQGS